MGRSRTDVLVGLVLVGAGLWFVAGLVRTLVSLREIGGLTGLIPIYASVLLVLGAGLVAVAVAPRWVMLPVGFGMAASGVGIAEVGVRRSIDTVGIGPGFVLGWALVVGGVGFATAPLRVVLPPVFRRPRWRRAWDWPSLGGPAVAAGLGTLLFVLGVRWLDAGLGAGLLCGGIEVLCTSVADPEELLVGAGAVVLAVWALIASVRGATSPERGDTDRVG